MPGRWSVLIWMSLGSTIGGYVPYLWGGEMFSYMGLLLTLIGGIAGIFIAVWIARFTDS